MRLLAKNLSDPSARTVSPQSEIFEGFGSPEGVQVGKMGDWFINRNGGAGVTLYLKESGMNTNTGWAAAGGGAGGWVDEEIFVATEGQTEFDLSSFTFTLNSQMTVDINGADQDEGGGLDWIRNVAQQRIVLNEAVTKDARVKIKLWKS